jgi:hypothetical protein
MKTTFHGRGPQKQKVGISQQLLVGSYPNSKLRLMGPSKMVWKLEMKTTSHGRLRIEISQQPLIGSYLNMKLWFMGPIQMLWKLKMKTPPHGRQHQK